MAASGYVSLMDLIDTGTPEEIANFLNFTPPPTPSPTPSSTLWKKDDTAQLLQLFTYVVYADYANAKILAETYPALMFKLLDITYSDGTCERISPLKFAFKVFDTPMWQLFANIAANYPTTHHKQFMRQLQEPIKPFTLEPVLAFYRHYNQLVARLNYTLFDPAAGKKTAVTMLQLNTALLNIGKAQYKYLPSHLLLEILRTQTHWSNLTTFAASTTQIPPVSYALTAAFGYQALHRPTGQTYSLRTCNDLKQSGLGSQFTLVRGKESPLCSGPHIVFNHRELVAGENNLDHDAALFEKILGIRAQELATYKYDALQLAPKTCVCVIS